jgi:hypothetical protein
MFSRFMLRRTGTASRDGGADVAAHDTAIDAANVSKRKAKNRQFSANIQSNQSLEPACRQSCPARWCHMAPAATVWPVAPKPTNKIKETE